MTDWPETPARIEPCLLEQISPDIVDLIATLSAAAERLGTRLHPHTAASPGRMGCGRFHAAWPAVWRAAATTGA